MIPILFDKTETEFISNGIGRLSDSITCRVTEKRNGEFELEMEYPVDGVHAARIATDMIIGATPAQGKDIQPFRIYAIQETIKGIMTVFAEHISYQLSFIPVEPFKASNCAAALAGLKNHASEPCPFTFWTDKTTDGNFHVDEPAAIRSLLGGTTGSILDVFGTGEYEFDKWQVKFYLHRGSNNGASFRYGKNIIDIYQEESIANTYTGVFPYWTGYDDEQQETILTLPEKVLHAATAANFPFNRTIPLDLSGSYETQPTEAQLRSAATSYMERNNIGIPKVSITLDVAALWQSEEYKDIACLEAVNLCDTVTVTFPKLGIDVEAKVTGLIWNVLLERYDSITIGDERTDLAGTITNVTTNAKEDLEQQTNILQAEIGIFKSVTAESITAVQGNIDRLKANEITAMTADIGELSALTARIKNLLAGSAGVGDLETITLNSLNATVDTAFLKNLLAQHVTVGDLMAGEINTNRFTVASGDGGFVLQGNTMQFYDDDGNVMLQIGQDAQGNYDFVVFDADGQGRLFDSSGIKPVAIPEEIIVNDMIAMPSSTSEGIDPRKLNINSLYQLLNDDGSGGSINASRIYFNEEQQTLNQIYSQLSNSLRTVENNQTSVVDKANTAEAAAQQAIDTSNRAIEALSGITTLDALGAQLTNDAHVVHTNFDGSGGDYSFAKSTLIAYLGDTDISDHVSIEVTPSAGITGTWNAATRTYQVTGLSTPNGYVDFDVAYGDKYEYLLMPNDLRILMPEEDPLKIKNGVTHVYKRFSVSKSPDGRAGSSYNLVCSENAIRITKQGTLKPTSITFSALYSDGLSVISYMGFYKIETSPDGVTYTEVYKSSSAEISKRFTPSADVRSIRCTLLDSSDQLLDMQTVIVLMDAEELVADLTQAQEAIQTVSTKMTTIETGMEGFRVDIADLTTDIHGVSDKVLLYQVTESETTTARTFKANLYKAGKLVTNEYPDSWFTWYKKNGDGAERVFAGTGKSITITKSSMPKGGSVVGVFNTFAEAVFRTPDNFGVVFPDENRLSLWVDDIGQFEEA